MWVVFLFLLSLNTLLLFRYPSKKLVVILLDTFVLYLWILINSLDLLRLDFNFNTFFCDLNCCSINNPLIIFSTSRLTTPDFIYLTSQNLIKCKSEHISTPVKIIQNNLLRRSSPCTLILLKLIIYITIKFVFIFYKADIIISLPMIKHFVLSSVLLGYWNIWEIVFPGIPSLNDSNISFKSCSISIY